MYRFDRVRDGFEAVGAYHGAELPYVFDTHDYWLPTSAVDRSLTHQLLEYWLTFAADGEPQGVVEWPHWDSDRRRMLKLGTVVESVAFPDTRLCQLLGQY